MYWRQTPSRRTMQNYLELARAASTRLNALDARETRWSVEVTLRRRANEPDAPGMFVSLTAKDVAEEVFHVTLDTQGGSNASHDPSGDASLVDDKNDAANVPSSSATKDRSVLVLRTERRCVQGEVAVKEYLSRCKTHRLTHRVKIEGTQFWAGDYALRVGKVENMQGTYAGTMVEIEYAPLHFSNSAENVLAEFAKHVDGVFLETEGFGVNDVKNTGIHTEDGKKNEFKPSLVSVPSTALAAFGLEDQPFGDAALATLYVACVASMQS